MRIARLNCFPFSNVKRSRTPWISWGIRISVRAKNELYYSGDIYICYSPAGRAVLGKTVPEVSSTARGRRPRAVLETEGTVFPNTDRPRPVNNIFIYF